MICTCAGTAPGYPQHESSCGLPEVDGWHDKWMYETFADPAGRSDCVCGYDGLSDEFHRYNRCPV